MSRTLADIKKDLDDAVADDSRLYKAADLDEFKELQTEYYRRIEKLIVERNEAEARLGAQRLGIPFKVATVEETAQMLLASE